MKFLVKKLIKKFHEIFKACFLIFIEIYKYCIQHPNNVTKQLA